MKLKRRRVGMIQSSSMSRAAPQTNGDMTTWAKDCSRQKKRETPMEGELAETVITCAKGILRPNRRSTETQWYLSSCPSLCRTGPARHGWLQQASCRARFSVVLRAGGGGTGYSGDAVPEESSSAVQWVSGFALRGPWSLWFFPARPALKKRSHDPFDPAATSQIFGGVKTPPWISLGEESPSISVTHRSTTTALTNSPQKRAGESISSRHGGKLTIPRLP